MKAMNDRGLANLRHPNATVTLCRRSLVIERKNVLSVIVLFVTKLLRVLTHPTSKVWIIFNKFRED